MIKQSVWPLVNKISVFFIFLILFLPPVPSLFARENIWQTGVARVDITPEDTLWMAGYASREHAAKGTLQQLWAKAIAFQDQEGKRAVLVTSDILGFPKNISERIATACANKYNLERSQLLLSSSHTHTGPVLRESLYLIYKMTDAHIGKIEAYSRHLENSIVLLIGEALKNMVPSRLAAGNGVVRFQINRRNNNEKNLSNQADLNGPNDYAVPVLQVKQNNEMLLATVFGYACHPTVLSDYQWSGDYPGFAQQALEEHFPGMTALFFQGCGADQNPLPRRSPGLAKQYGRELAAAVERVIEENQDTLQAKLKTGFSEINLVFDPPPSKERIEKLAADSTAGFRQVWAKSMLDKIKNRKPLPTSYPYPIQIWQLGDQLIVALGGEVVINYALTLKRLFGQNTFVMGYCNDVMGYIPSLEILREGGYEGAVAQIVYDLPASWRADIETQIISHVITLAENMGIGLQESNLLSD
jgi:hypothetical protein